jgi:hypothetical protein
MLAGNRTSTLHGSGDTGRPTARRSSLTAKPCGTSIIFRTTCSRHPSRNCSTGFAMRTQACSRISRPRSRPVALTWSVACGSNRIATSQAARHFAARDSTASAFTWNTLGKHRISNGCPIVSGLPARCPRSFARADRTTFSRPSYAGTGTRSSRS